MVEDLSRKMKGVGGMFHHMEGLFLWLPSGESFDAYIH